jgi:hypothetical protein
MRTTSTTTIIGLIITGVVVIAGGVGSVYAQMASVMAYTDQSVGALRSEQLVVHKETNESIEQLKKDLGEVKKDTAVMRAILEERFARKK